MTSRPTISRLVVPSLLPVTDDELSAVALAADPDVAVDDDAVCVSELTGDAPAGWLPEWYMPSAMGGARLLRGWRRAGRVRDHRFVPRHHCRRAVQHLRSASSRVTGAGR